VTEEKKDGKKKGERELLPGREEEKEVSYSSRIVTHGFISKEGG